MPPGPDDLRPTWQRHGEARIDVRDVEHYVFQMRTPEGHVLRMGRDRLGPWIITLNGNISRDDGNARPAGIDIGGESLLTGSVDEFLAMLLLDFDLSLEAEGNDGAQHIRAIARENAGARTPKSIDLWIDSETDLMTQMDVRFERARPRGGPPPRRHRPQRRLPAGWRFELEGTESLPKAWFLPETHQTEAKNEQSSRRS